MNLLSPMLRALDRLSPPERVSAHCDIPCGIYDPHAAQVAALTVLRMNQLIKALDRSNADLAAMQIARYTQTKESHAELCKKELDILWHDYFRPEHLEKYPDLHTKFWMANKLASRNKQSIDEQAANDLLNAVNEIAEIFWATKNVPTRRGPSNQTAGGEFVYPAN
ncbi:MAG TPA: superoxide dismutase, Ni [Dehalococcoidia bacterium]|nr:superoxide dismutase, Ni [Dehalococcoidia bacterium]